MDAGTVIVAACSFLGTLFGAFGGFRLIEYRVKKLEEKVDKHNNVIERTFILEEQIKTANHRIDDLERHEETREGRRK